MSDAIGAVVVRMKYIVLPNKQQQQDQQQQQIIRVTHLVRESRSQSTTAPSSTPRSPSYLHCRLRHSQRPLLPFKGFFGLRHSIYLETIYKHRGHINELA
jgi:hypothetical protein